MKSILVGPKESEVKKDKFPCLMLSDKGRVVLFMSDSIGTVVHVTTQETSVMKVGEYCTTWQMESFEPLKGKITLSN